MDTSQCPYCREEIKLGAIKCKHCKSMLINIPLQTPSLSSEKNSDSTTLWLPLPSMVLGIISFLSLLDDSDWNEDQIIGLFALAINGLILGIVSINTQQKGKGLAITGIVLSSLSLLAGIGIVSS